MNPRILMSVLTILGVVALAGTGAYAAFSAQASNEGNTFGTGTLTLVINPNASPFPSPIFTVAGAKPGDTKDQSIQLKNTGTVDATVVKTTLPLTSGNSELANVLSIKYYVDSGIAGTPDAFDGTDTVLGEATLDNAVWNGYTLPGITIPAGTSTTIRALLTFSQSADDAYQNKNMTFSLGFQANQ